MKSWFYPKQLPIVLLIIVVTMIITIVIVMAVTMTTIIRILSEYFLTFWTKYHLILLEKQLKLWVICTTVAASLHFLPNINIVIFYDKSFNKVIERVFCFK